MRQAIDRAHRAITAHAHTHGIAPRDFAATLLVALATPRWLAAAQVGDGAIGLTTDGLENLALQMPQRLPIPGFWQPMFRRLQQTGPQPTTDELNHFLQSDRVRAKSADDLTILIAVAS